MKEICQEISIKISSFILLIPVKNSFLLGASDVKRRLTAIAT